MDATLAFSRLATFIITLFVTIVIPPWLQLQSLVFRSTLVQSIHCHSHIIFNFIKIFDDFSLRSAFEQSFQPKFPQSFFSLPLDRQVLLAM